MIVDPNIFSEAVFKKSSSVAPVPGPTGSASFDPSSFLSSVLSPSTTSSYTATSTATVTATATATATSVPSPYIEAANDAGHRTLWVVFVIMVIASIAFAAMSWSVPVSRRLYHVITTTITVTAAISYFAMAVGDGVSIHPIDKHLSREVYWARYVDWAITTPLLLLDLGLLAGLNGAYISIAIAADLIMVLTGLFASFGTDNSAQKWGWYAIACIAYLVIVWHLAIHGRAAAVGKGQKVGTFFASIAGFTLILWTAYPIVWGVLDGSRKASSVDAEIIAYAVLDVLAKPVFGLWLLLTHSRLPETNVDLGGFWAHGLSSEGSIRVGDDDEGA